MTPRVIVFAVFFVVCCQCAVKDDRELYNILQRQNEVIEFLKKELESQKQTISDQEAEMAELRTLITSSSERSDIADNGRNTAKKAKRILLDNVNLPEHQREGAIYIRWGSERCPPNGSETVYSGYAGGAPYTITGGAAEYVCLPPDPKYGAQINVTEFNYLYGAEYKTNYIGPAANEDVPCAVCRSTTGYSTLMIPARDECYTGWKREYHGRLASGHPGHAAASQFVCVDAFPNVLAGGSPNREGKLFFPVKSICGSLKCPPCEMYKEVLCVVCTR